MRKPFSIPEGELVVRATRAGGPGGQHVNKTSSRIELVWNVRTSRAIDDAQRERITARLGSRMDGEGNVRVVSSDTRSQRQNRLLAESRLIELVRKALVVPKVRRPTRPGRGAVEERLAAKRRQSERKRDRRDFESD